MYNIVISIDHQDLIMFRMQYLKKCEELFELNASAKVDSIQKADEVMSKANAKV